MRWSPENDSSPLSFSLAPISSLPRDHLFYFALHGELRTRHVSNCSSLLVEGELKVVAKGSKERQAHVPLYYSTMEGGLVCHDFPHDSLPFVHESYSRVLLALL